MLLLHPGVLTFSALPLSPPPPSHPLNRILQGAVLSPRSRETTGVSYPISLPIAATNLASTTRALDTQCWIPSS